MVRGVAYAVVQEVARERLDARAFRHLHGLVYVCSLPTSARAAIEAQLVVGIPAAAAYPAVHVEGAARDAVAVREMRLVVGVAQLKNRHAKLVRDALVCVEAEDPIVC